MTKNIDKLIDQLPLIMSDLMLTLANDAKALIQQRVQEKGLNAQLNKTPDYSDQYKKRRQKKGLQVNHMDLTLSGEMWRSTGIVNSVKTDKQIIVTIAGRDDETQNKINWNSEKQFEVLKLSKPEEDLLYNEIASEYLEERIKI
jgi:adenine-specific DNA glycosylase